ncbi:MAG: hypothetical protein HOK98_10430 [Rhodospirillaceae bacterium]|jgi:hypothetical protein|nr:hypothetical protein [Rhodospirillaceae bacterium]MBT5945369.1 hypothetical protein [Rhodospirillaceae bacterium]MBT6404878.1 hypothetical protein [Rhodospirillaceae bacterium]MBT6536591.1 hypothetical protein [Rhodospirillaceae bacterium]MBT7360880.1 hypothetical protein [Rhodospirillaceae bacterium]
MLNYCRKASGLIAVWAVFLGILMIWPNAPDARATSPAYEFVEAGASSPSVQAANYTHTGLWVADVQTDGTVVYLRQIKRR